MKTQIGLSICPVRLVSLLPAGKNIRSLATHWAHSEDSDQTGRMPRLIWVFAGRTGQFVVFVMRRLIYFRRSTTKPTKCHVRPAKTQISLNIRPVWSVFAVNFMGSSEPKLCSSRQQRLWISLSRCQGWSEISLGAHVISYPGHFVPKSFRTILVISYPLLFSIWSFRTQFSHFVPISYPVRSFRTYFHYFLENRFGHFVPIFFTVSYPSHFVPEVISYPF